MNLAENQSLTAARRAVLPPKNSSTISVRPLSTNIAQTKTAHDTGIFKYAGGARRRFEFNDMIYLLQRRPAHTDVILNHKSQGIRVLDPWNGTDFCRIDFTKGYDSSGLINGWCLRSDGQAVLVLHQESRTASLLSLTASSASYDLKAPPLPEMSDLRYIWENDSFWLTGGHCFASFNLQWQEGKPTFVERGTIYARIKHRAWRQALDKLKILSSKVLRVEPDKERLIYYDFDEKPEQMGVLNWGDKTQWSIPAYGYVPVMAYHKEHLFLMHDYEVHAINHARQVETIYLVPEGFYCSGVDIIPSHHGHPAALVVACSWLRNPERSQILLYELED